MSPRVSEYLWSVGLLLFVLAMLAIDGWLASMPWPPMTAGGG